MEELLPTESPRHRLLSVVIPAYNAAETLDAQLEALKAQQYDGDWEIVVVNNDSTDNTVKLVQEYQHSMPHLRLIHATAKHNKSYARNMGAEAAQGTAFIFCDADDVVAPGWLQAMAEALAHHDFVAGSREVETLNQAAIWRPSHSHGAGHRIFDFLPFVSSSNMAVSREGFEVVGGFSEEFFSSHDVDFSWRLQLQGYTIYDAPGALIHYRYRASWWGVWKQTVGFAESQILLYKRFMPQGMPPPKLREARKRYRYLIRSAPYAWREHQSRARWIRTLAICWGRLRGSIRYRILAL